jgi:hypothetical protein
MSSVGAEHFITLAEESSLNGASDDLSVDMTLPGFREVRKI